MEIVTAHCDKRALEMFGTTLQRPDAWMALTVQHASLHREMLEYEGLSRETMAKMSRISTLLAATLSGVGLDYFQGKIFAFEDGDLLAFYEKEAILEDDMMRALRKDPNLVQFVTIEPINACRQELSRYIRTKRVAALEHHMRECMLTMADNLDPWVKPEHAVTETVRKKRRMRKTSTVLVIEDDPLVSELLTNMLKDHHHVISKSNAKDGILSYAHYAPDVVFLDINMPGMNGHETLKRIISLDADAYVVMISGQSSQDNVLDSHANGATGFLAKPFSKEKLRGYLRDCPSLNSKMRLQAG